MRRHGMYSCSFVLGLVLTIGLPLTATSQPPPEGPPPYTPAADARDLKSVLFNWTWHMGMLRGVEEHELTVSLEYQGNGTIQVDGQPCTLTKVAFTNPHGAMYLDVANADGTVTNWVMTTGSANTLANLGFGTGGPNTVKAGDAVTITYFPARNGKPLGFIRSIVLADKREIQISSGSSED